MLMKDLSWYGCEFLQYAMIVVVMATSAAFSRRIWMRTVI